MKKLVLAGAFAALALTATGANAAPVSATTNATGKVRILTPLKLESTQNFDLGTIVLSGPSGFSTSVGLNQAGALTCDTTKVTCSGTTSVAKYKINGTPGAVVTVTAPNVSLSNGSATLTLTLDAPASVTLTSAATTLAGEVFSIGGSIPVTSATADGVYTGNFNISADYQ
ncbi:DUF4402 domain-containing protein [Sphingomonas sinipercae]|uniref:DUF4402 domain-containing protein n=1 Tax=Sphingomonas sinipercae TaxID=2714944 RepID=A0A6G7ZKT5_9SPHN|nr:DUF4402 domain-containing protein [Sphingomonas sinipercae]QIL01542.1 DUF4402 domain-containing protein [Sphingomonas sinipercae]